MLPWLFLEPDALFYLPVRPTNSGCCVSPRVCVGRGKKSELNFFLLTLFSYFCLAKAPSSLLEALEQHLASLEGKKTKELNADTR